MDGLKEKKIKEWFESWYNPSWNIFDEIFENDVYYSESWRPEYFGIFEIKKWFSKWHFQSKLLKWEIKLILHFDCYTMVEWRFGCSDNGEVTEFDGVSLIEWSDDCKISSLKEFGSSLPKYAPFRDF